VKIAPIIGLFGDFFTFVGGIVLAWDVLRGPAHMERAHKIEEVLNRPSMKNRIVIIKGVRIEDTKGIDRVFIHLASRNAKIGSILLAIGFFLLLIHRVLELSE
jgi:hypothetical protein